VSLSAGTKLGPYEIVYFSRRLLLVSILLPAVAAAGVSQDDVAARIAGAAMTRRGASAFLETLTDTVGGRVTGSPQNRAASELILSALKQAGYDNARFEEYPLASRWQRGPASGRIVAPIDRAISIGSMAWVPGTPGRVEVALVDIGKPPSNDWMPPAERVRGAAVLVEPHKVGDDPAFVMRSLIAKKLAEAGAVAMLMPSDKPGRMLYTSAFGFYPKGPLPVISVAKEDTLLLRRLLTKGPVKLSLDVRNTFDMSPYNERNVVADLPGAALKDEVVLLGAHFDSWDPAEGANDDGSGVAAVLEAARILKSLNVRPLRTIRFAFFSGEEEGCLGSRAYVAAHERELDRLRAVLVMDSGAQAPKGVELHGRADLEKMVKKLLAPLEPFGADGVTLDATFDRDHAPFLLAGVPALTLWVEPAEYDIHHHAITDTFDKVDPRMLAVDTAVMGIAAWSFANAAEPVGRRLSPAEAAELMKKTGVESTWQMVYGSSPR
jgi:Iap family predicted aminopeptidase